MCWLASGSCHPVCVEPILFTRLLSGSTVFLNVERKVVPWFRFQAELPLSLSLLIEQSSQSGVQNVILWWENFGDRGKKRLGSLRQPRNLSPQMSHTYILHKVLVSQFDIPIYQLFSTVQFVTICDAVVQFCSYFLFQRSHGQESFACHKVHLQNRSWSSNHWSSNVQCQCPMLFAITC